MIDIHSHILFSIDDGAKTMDESLSIIKEAIESGVKTIVCTPHFNPRRDYILTYEEIRKPFSELVNRVKEENLPITLFLSREVYFELGYEVGKEMLLGDNHCLVEFSFTNRPDFDEIGYEFGLREITPIIAHIERYNYIDYNDCILLRDLGFQLSINARSVLGKEGNTKLVKKLLKHQMVDYITSDTHHSGGYKDFKSAYELLSKKDMEYANELFCLNATDLLKE